MWGCQCDIRIVNTQTLIDFDEEKKLTEIIPDIIPEEKKPISPPTEMEEVDEEDFEDEDEYSN